MNYEVLHSMTKGELLDYCTAIDSSRTALADVCTAQSNVIKDLANASKDFNILMRAHYDFTIMSKSALRLEEEMFNKYYYNQKESSDDMESLFTKPEDVPQEPKLDADTPTVSEALKSLGNAVEGCFG